MAETADQVEKDLRLEQLVVEEQPDTTPFDALYAALFPVVKAIVAHHTSDLPQHFYQVDLSEGAVAEALSSEDPVAAVTEAIIRRCFQKVVLRKLYKKGEKDKGRG